MIERGGIAPYAPASAVMAVIDAKRRNPALGGFSAQELATLDIRESLVPRTMQALKLLELLDDEDRTTEVFDELVSSSRPDFSSRLGALLRRVYAPVFEVVDPVLASQDDLLDVFRQFRPPSQRPRMVTLFIHLLRVARMSPSEEARSAVREYVLRPDGAVETTSSPKEMTYASDTDVARRRARQAWGTAVASPQSGGLSRHRLKLASGGSVDIGLNVDLFSLSKEDRDFVMDLVDRVTNYKPKRIEGDPMN